jgi:Protein of unknown function (DUF1116)
MNAGAPPDPADRRAIERIAACRPVVRELVTAREALGLAEGELGHAGPPFDPGQAPSPVVLGALAGAVVHEGWAGTQDAAVRMVLDGAVRLRPNHSMAVVSPMAGVVRPSQPLFRVEDAASGASAFATLAERGRRVLRFGHYGDDVAAGLRHVESVIGPAIARALPTGGLPVLPLIARAVELGDDVHQRNIGGMHAFLAALMPLRAPERDWLAGHPQHFLNYAMAAAKLSLDRAIGVTGSRIVTAISRNGLDCGVQVAGLPDRWFKAPATLPDGCWFDGHGPHDAHGDLGDSAIMEAFGLGGCIAHASPEIARIMHRDWPEALEAGLAMRTLFVARHADIAPALAGHEGVGLGLDAARAAGHPGGVRIHTGVAHRDVSGGWIGVGVAHAPQASFAAAMDGLAAAGGS